MVNYHNLDINLIEEDCDKNEISSLINDLSMNEYSSDVSTEIMHILRRKSKVSSSKSINSGLAIPLPKKTNSSVHIPRISKPSIDI